MDWLKSLFSAIISAVGKPLTYLGAYLAGMMRGREQQRNAQTEQDMDAIKRATDARNAVTDDDSMRLDENNRDND